PVFETLIGFRKFKHDYAAAAQLLRLRWSMGMRAADGQQSATRALHELLALHAMHGPLDGFQRDLLDNLDNLFDPAMLYSLGEICRNHNARLGASLLFQLAYARGIASSETREASSEFLLEQGWTDLAERELLAITNSWFATGPTVDSARMRLGLLNSSL